MSSLLQPIHSNPKLKAQVLLIGDVGCVDKVGVACSHRSNHRAERRTLRRRLLHRLPFHGHLVEGHLHSITPRLAVEASGNELVAVGVNEIARHVFAQGRCRWSGQAEGVASCLPERNLCPTNHRPDLEAIARQESFGRQHAERIEVVVPFGLAAAPTSGLDLLH